MQPPKRPISVAKMVRSLMTADTQRLGHGYETAKSQRIFQDFIDATATIMITEREVIVRFQKRAHNPLLLAAGFQQTDLPIPWLLGRRLQFQFG